LLNLSRQRNEDFQFCLTRYALERFLYRLSKSGHAEKFVLKGALLLMAWTDQPYRPTKDLDMLGFGESTPDNLERAIAEICQTEVEFDGLFFDVGSIEISEIREGQGYQGKRVRLMAALGNARVPLQIDMAFGDAITPSIEEIDYPALLEMPVARVRAYPKETVVSEKMEAAVRLDLQNSRMKDFFDLLWLSRLFPFEGALLVKAIGATFKRRKTELPAEVPLFLSKAFASDQVKQIQWRAFLKKNSISGMPGELDTVISELNGFLIPPLKYAVTNEPFTLHWPARGPWQ
jgi:hypothetical protein